MTDQLTQDSTQDTRQTTPFHASARYRLNGKLTESPFTIELPADATPGQRIGALQTYARENFDADHESGMTVIYRQDGSDQPINGWEKFTDILKLIFMLDGVIERHLYVPVWPRPKN